MSSILSEIILVRNKDVTANLLVDYYDCGTSLLDFVKILKFVKKDYLRCEAASAH